MDSIPVLPTNAESHFIGNDVSSSFKTQQTSSADHTKDARQPLVNPSLATSGDDHETHVDTLPIGSSENTEIPDYSAYDSNIFSPANDDLYADSDIHGGHDDFQHTPETEANDYIFLDLPEEEKRFMRGLKRYTGSSETNQDKRFMRGLKRDTGNSETNEDKRFMRGLTFKRDFDVEDSETGDTSPEEKRFMRGFKKYAKKDDKRFMRGLRDDSFNDLIENDKRFMRGLRSLDYDNVEEKRFIIGLNRLARLDKRFMRGFGNYNKRFIHGLQNYGKRFMRGLMKRDQSAALDNKKRFIVGLNNYGRRASTLRDFAPELGSGTEDMSKRFIKGLRPYANSNHGKRFMKGFRLYSKKYGPFTEENSKLGNDMSSDKRFMRGLTKKHSDSNGESDGNNLQLVPGTLVESDSINNQFDKRFIKGLGKKSDVSGEDLDKRFIKGLGKKSDVSGEDLDKRFIKGLVRKSEDDKRFMRGLHKKFDGNGEKRFIKGFLTNGNTLNQPLGAFDNSDDINDEVVDKRFMRGFGKKNTEEKELQSVSDKRFMRGLYSKKESKGEDNSQPDKRFMRGFHKFAKKDNELTDDEMNNVDENSVMQGSSSFENERKRFIKGLTKKEGKRFIKGLRNYVKKDDDDAMEGSEVDVEKRFMRGLVKKSDAIDESQDEKRFIKGLVKKASYGEEEADTSVSDSSRTSAKNDSQLDKRFMRGLVKRESGALRQKRETRFQDDNDVDLLSRLTGKGNYDKGDSLFETRDNAIWHDLPVYDSEFTHNKRFMRGLGRYAKRDYDLDESSNEFDDIDHGFDENQDISKRFIKGFLGNYNNGKRVHYVLTKPDEFDSISGAEKRFIKGLDMYTRPLGKRFMRGLKQYGKRSYDDTYLEDKRFMRGLNPYIRTMDKRFMRGLGRFAKRPTGGDNLYSSESYHRRFPAEYLNLVPQHQLLSPSYRHSQLISSFHDDQNRQFEV